MACTFSASQLPKVVTHQFFTLLTWKSASRHNGVHFFSISTSKSGPNTVYFVHFDLEMCFAPQQRTHTYTFSTSQLPKVVRTWCALYILTSKCASCHGVQFFISHLASWLRTRRFHKSLGKHSESRLFYLFAHLHFLSSLIFSLLFFSSLTLTLPTSAFPNCPYCRKFHF